MGAPAEPRGLGKEEAAALVVTDDDFSSVVEAVRLGRRIDENLRRAMVVVALLQGASVLVASLLVFRSGLPHAGSEGAARAMAFTTRNVASWAVVAGAAITLGLVLEVPFLRRLLSVSWFEAWKLPRRSPRPPPPPAVG